MPIIYKCSRCGFPLYVFTRVGQSPYGVKTPTEIIYIHGGRCPRCGKPLEKPRIGNVRISTSVEEEASRYTSEIRGYLPLTALTIELTTQQPAQHHTRQNRHASSS